MISEILVEFNQTKAIKMTLIIQIISLRKRGKIFNYFFMLNNFTNIFIEHKKVSERKSNNQIILTMHSLEIIYS